jgi:hypothetical protein
LGSPNRSVAGFAVFVFTRVTRHRASELWVRSRTSFYLAGFGTGTKRLICHWRGGKAIFFFAG